MHLDKGICEFCEKPVWLNERTVYFKKGNIAHYECYEEILKGNEKEEPRL